MLIVGYRVSRIYEQLEQPRFCKLAMNMMFDKLMNILGTGFSKMTPAF